jgi:cell division protein FtsI (penicillin-binding protein 3)
MIQPLIVKSINNAGVIKQKYSISVLNKKICSDETLKKVRSLLESVVLEGTASNIRHSIYPIAGKTGTSQKLKDGRYTKQYYTSFVGYFPADNPKYSCIVVIDNPKGYRQYGSDVAAPVFKEIADKVYALDLEMHAPYSSERYIDESIFPVIRAGKRNDLQMICNILGISNHAQTQEEWVRTSRVSNSVHWKSNQIRNGLVPNVTGMTLRDAIYLLENEGLVVTYKGYGRILKQSQNPGKKALKGSKISLELG